MNCKNDITGDSLRTRASTEQYRNNYDVIFGKKKSDQATLVKTPEGYGFQVTSTKFLCPNCKDSNGYFSTFDQTGYCTANRHIGNGCDYEWTRSEEFDKSHFVEVPTVLVKVSHIHIDSRNEDTPAAINCGSTTLQINSLEFQMTTNEWSQLKTLINELKQEKAARWFSDKYDIPFEQAVFVINRVQVSIEFGGVS